jgi:hypothetical protein
MRLKKPRVASIDEVRIIRQAESVLIEFETSPSAGWTSSSAPTSTR